MPLSEQVSRDYSVCLIAINPAEPSLAQSRSSQPSLLYFHCVITHCLRRMRVVGNLLLASALVTFCYPNALRAAESESRPAPDLQEVYQLIRAHLKGVTDSELNRTAVQALVSSLSPRVSLV